MLRPPTPRRSRRCIAVGGVAVFPADTVYGLACEPDTREAVERLYALKGRAPGQARGGHVLRPRAGLRRAARARAAHARAARRGCCPAAITALLPNPLRRYPLACGRGPRHTLGLRVPGARPAIEALAGDALARAAELGQRRRRRSTRTGSTRCRRRSAAAPTSCSTAASWPGTPSTVVDLRRFELDGMWAVLRQGAVPEREIELAAAEA